MSPGSVCNIVTGYMEGYWIVFGFTWSRVQLYSGSASEAAGAAATVSSSKTTSCNLNVVALHFWARQISEGKHLVGSAHELYIRSRATVFTAVYDAWVAGDWRQSRTTEHTVLSAVWDP